MATKKKPLPEISVGAPQHADLVNLAKEALTLRSQLAALTTRETEVKKQIAEKASAIRVHEERVKGNFVGLVRVTDAGQTPCQIQFKMCGGALAIEDEATLDTLFGSARTSLWERDVAAQDIINPDGAIAECVNRGQNPWDYLDIKVKKDLDRNFIGSPNVTMVEAFLPKEGFLATCNETKHTFPNKEKAAEYLAAYTEQVLKPAVDLGKK
jgi:hypothetical protein